MDKEKKQTSLSSDEALQTLYRLRQIMASQQQALKKSALGDGERGEGQKAPIHMADQASDVQEMEMLAERLTASTETIVEIDEAIENIKNGKFNQCEECGKAIGERRLKIQPWASVCVDCKRKQEE